MIHRCFLSLLVLGLVCGVADQAAGAEAGHVCRYCEGGHALRPGEGVLAASGRNYAPHRLVDVTHVKIEVTPDFKGRSIAGRTTIQFTPISTPVEVLTLDAVDLTVSKVEGSAAIADYHVTSNAIVIHFKEPIGPGVAASVTVSHSAQPQRGLYFRTPSQGYKEVDTHLWTQGETHEARHWFPSVDYPNERFTSEMICHVPKDMIVISNGRLISESVDGKTGLKVSHWKQEQPHVNYLIALAAGRFKFIEETYRDIPMRFYTPASQIEHAKHSFKDTADMMGFFESYIDVNYPWAKYDQVVVDDFHWGGMENTTMTILTDRTLHPAGTEPTRSSQGLVAHELAHQWFGDYLTCKDWSHLWLNEGFATYFAHLYSEHKNGRDDFLYGLYRDSERITSQKDERRPIAYRSYKQSFEQFDRRAYQKGSWVLHMLRVQLGDVLFRKCLHEYVTTNANRSVITQDLQDACERVTGLSLTQFFDQWVYHARHPELVVAQSWDPKTKLAKISVKQMQVTNAEVLLFSFKVKLRFRTVEGITEQMVEVTEKEQEFFVPLASKPVVVWFDAESGLLCTLKFDKPKEMLLAQLQERDDPIGRVRAIEGLAKHDDAATIEALTMTLNEDPFWGVRVEACKALRSMRSDAARAAMLASFNQPDARVRKQLVEDAGSLYHPDAQAAMLRVIERGDANLDVFNEAIERLANVGDDATKARLIALLTSDSYRQATMMAAVRALRKMDDPALVGPVMRVLKAREDELRSSDFGEALDAVAWLARNDEKRDAVRTFIAGYVNSPMRNIQTRAIRALGTLRDAKAIAIVESFSGDSENDPIAKAAEEALKVLRDEKPAPVEVKDLRGEVDRLRKDNDALRKDVDELKKKIDALGETK
ncbi:MAG: M1 family aminopeptidase [Phycisphaeraceae bacterium]